MPQHFSLARALPAREGSNTANMKVATRSVASVRAGRGELTQLRNAARALRQVVIGLGYLGAGTTA
eukprot:scaffold220_cov430-Prasinococcus_capsulatus_cf.AAC.1